jgi:aryl sulfotransferase
MPDEMAHREYRTWICDSRRWQRFRPRPDDIVLSTYPKSGTTWMQRILSLLICQSTDPIPIMQISAWVDRRFPQSLDDLTAQIEARTHRRFLKSHLPRDGLPFLGSVKYIYVARDGRDVAMSFHNHAANLTDGMLQQLDRAGLDDNQVGRSYPRSPSDAGEFIHRWLTQGVVPGEADGSPTMSFFHFVSTWWKVRDRPNVLLVHYNDLKADLSSEMDRIAAFLDIKVEPSLWPQLVRLLGLKPCAVTGIGLWQKGRPRSGRGAEPSSIRAAMSAGGASRQKKTLPSMTPKLGQL